MFIFFISLIYWQPCYITAQKIFRGRVFAARNTIFRGRAGSYISGSAPTNPCPENKKSKKLKQQNKKVKKYSTQPATTTKLL